MKKKLIALFTIVFIGLLYSFSFPNDDSTDDRESEAASANPIAEKVHNSEVTSKETVEEEFTFEGTIEQINGNMALVSVEKGEILNSGSKVDVYLSVATDTEFQIGDKVKVGYDGVIREIFPLSINTTYVEKME